MIESVGFTNFKALRNTTLPLGAFTLLVGANGSGKSTALRAFHALQEPTRYSFDLLASTGWQQIEKPVVALSLSWGVPCEGARTTVRWEPRSQPHSKWQYASGDDLPVHVRESLQAKLARVRVFSLEPRILLVPVALQPRLELGPEGDHFAGVLDRLRDEDPERFEALNDELGRLLPEFDRILFDTPDTGRRLFSLRVRKDHHVIPAASLSQGTLFALAILTLAYLSDPPPLVGLEEPDRGIHPRLLRQVRDALYRLSYPKSFGEQRQPVQVIATTHSPYFLDLFKDHPEEIVIAQKAGHEARFERLVDRPDITDILADTPLGEVWYSGVLGGVPVQS
jgi:predicted ATPase